MFPNKQPMPGIDRSEVFAAMLQDIPWNGLKNCAQMNAQIHKRCTVGGHRLEAKGRSRIEKLFLRQVEREDFPEALCNAVFAFWYPLQGELHDKLEAHFHSDEYKKYRADNKLDENAYVLTDQQFEEWFNVSDLQKWRALLCFSPLEFSEEQARKITESAQGNTELLQNFEELQKALAERDSAIARLNNELSSTRDRVNTLNEEAKGLRQERKNLKTDCDKAVRQAETARKENVRLKEKEQAFEQEIAQIRQQHERESARQVKLLQDDLARQVREVEAWREKYEKLHGESRQLKEKIQKAEKALAEQRIANDKSRKEIQRGQKFIDLLLSRIDWAEVGRQIKLTPQLKLRFNSLIRNLHYDESNRPKMDVPLEKFWDSLQNQERKLIKDIAGSDTLEVENGDVEGFWRDLEDSFEDIQIGLESRTILLQIIHEILYQTMALKDLRDDTIPAAMTRPKKSG